MTTVLAEKPTIAQTRTRFTATTENPQVILDLKSSTLDYIDENAIFPPDEPVGGFQISNQRVEIICEVSKTRLETKVEGIISQKERRFTLQPTNRSLPYEILHDLPGCIFKRVWNYFDKQGPFPQSNIQIIAMLPMDEPNYQQKLKLVGKAYGATLTVQGSKAILDPRKSSFGVWDIVDNKRLIISCNLPGGRAVGQAAWNGNNKTTIFNLQPLSLKTKQAKSSCKLLDNQALIQPEVGLEVNFKMF